MDDNKRGSEKTNSLETEYPNIFSLKNTGNKGGPPPVPQNDNKQKGDD